MARIRWCALVLVAVVLTACDAHVVQQVDQERSAAGLPALARDEVLDQQASDHAAEMCAARTAAPSTAPADEYDGETFAAVDDLAGAAPLDASNPDGAARNVAATKQVIAGWAGDPMHVDPRWDEMGVGEKTCKDGRLYVSAVFAEEPTMPASGRYAAAIYGPEQITRTRDQKYGTAVNYLGQTIDLFLDVWTPPAGPTPTRPTVVLIHGGGFQGGTREDWAQGAVDLARLGYVTASISYRLRPSSSNPLPAAADGIDDGMEAVRWLKANAGRFGIDTTRMAALGESAGGVIALGIALGDDLTPGGPLAAYSPSVSAAVSTGAHLTPGLSMLTLHAEDPAVLMVNFEDDPTAGDADVAFQTCDAVRRSGNTCDFIRRPGEGHLSWVTPGSSFWPTDTGPFLWHHLRLG